MHMNTHCQCACSIAKTLISVAKELAKITQF